MLDGAQLELQLGNDGIAASHLAGHAGELRLELGVHLVHVRLDHVIDAGEDLVEVVLRFREAFKIKMT